MEEEQMDYLLPGEKGPAGAEGKAPVIDAKAVKKNSKKQKRLDAFITRELKKDMRVKLYAKLSTQHFSSPLLHSSKKLGVTKLTAKEKLTRSLLEERAGLASTIEDSRLLVEQDVKEYDEVMEREEPKPARSSLVARAFDPVYQTAEIIEADGYGSSLKLTDTVLAAIPVAGSALKRQIVGAPSKPKKKKRKTALVKKDSDSSSEDEVKGTIWASNVVDGEKSIEAPLKSIKTVPIKVVEEVERKPSYFVKVTRSEDIQLARMSLPVVGEEQPIMETILANSVTILCGETGSGKTTQVPQFLYEAGFGDPNHPLYPGMIGVTQPRRVAAVSMAQRVSDEMNLHDGQVTYQIRYDKAQLGSNTRIKFMTDGILLRELSSLVQAKGKGKGDLLLSSYSCIIIDEAHERTVGTDILIGWLTRIVKLRNSGAIKGIGPLKLVIMSATLRVEDFTLNEALFPKDLGPPPVVKVDGRQHKVVIHYNKRTPEMDYLSEAFKKICKIHNKLPDGGILVFVTGQQEVQVLCKKLEEKFGSKKKKTFGATEENISDDLNDIFEADVDGKGDLIDDYEGEIEGEEGSSDEEEVVQYLNGSIEDEPVEGSVEIIDRVKGVHVLPLYSMLPTVEQLKVFKEGPKGTRLIVIATNVAETSLTIPGIKYVVDSGKVKERCFDSQTGIQNFKVSWTSAASADQRAGRAGRVGPGHCYRLFSSAVFSNYFALYSQPEILRIPIPGVVLSMKSMGVQQVINFPFPTPPDKNHLRDAETLLTRLSALDDQKITKFGIKMAQFPVGPRYARMILAASNQASIILMYTLCMVAALSVGDIFTRDLDLISDVKVNTVMLEEEPEATVDVEERERRKGKRGEYFKKMQMFAGTTPTSDLLMMLKAVGAYMTHPKAKLKVFCEDHFLREKAMDEVVKLTRQLVNIANSSFGLELKMGVRMAPPTAQHEGLLRQVILAGYVDSVARLDEERMSGHGKHAVPTYQTMWSLPDEAFVIHTSSCLYRERPAPKWVVYDQVQSKQEISGPDGQRLLLREDKVERKYMKGVTIISDTWLLDQAFKLANVGRVLEQPEPRYINKLDVVKGFISPTFGPKLWPLPLSEKVITQFKDGAVYFAKSVLDGSMFEKDNNVFSMILPYFTTKPSVVTKPWALNQAKVSRLIDLFITSEIMTKKGLMERWLVDKSFMLDIYLLWCPREFHRCLTENWPPVVLKNETVKMNGKLASIVLTVTKSGGTKSD